jgi:hypothetical protein
VVWILYNLKILVLEGEFANSFSYFSNSGVLLNLHSAFSRCYRSLSSAVFPFPLQYPETSLNTPTMSPKPFRAIIVGGGPVGLTAAHIFDKLGLDFLVLEQYHSLAPEVGGALALWSPTLRIMDQLGLWDTLASIVNPLYDKVVFTQAGGIVVSNSVFTEAEERYL